MRAYGLHWIMVLYFTLGSCISEVQTQARVANTIALAANGLLPALVSVYRDEGIRRIRTASDRASAEQSLADLRERWRPLWGRCDGPLPGCEGGAWEALRQAHDQWATLLERQINGEQMTLPQVQEVTRRLERNFCAVRAAVPAESRSTIPDVEGVRCP